MRQRETRKKTMRWSSPANITTNKILTTPLSKSKSLVTMVRCSEPSWMAKKKSSSLTEWGEKHTRMGTPLSTSTITTSSRHMLTRRLSITLLMQRRHRPHILMGYKFLNFQIDRLKNILLMGPKRLCKCEFFQLIYRFRDGTIKCIFAYCEDYT